MEELLASIRLIIADGGKGTPLPKEEGTAYAAVGGTGGQTGSQSASAAEDVLDLTEELVFPEDRIAPQPEPHTQEIQWEARPRVEDSKVAIPAPPAAAEDFPAPHARFPAVPARPANSRAARHETRGQAPPAGIQPVWSRRELPSAASQYRTPSSRLRPDAAAKPEAKNWGGDIQMPVPDQGPVSLIGGGAGKPRLQEREAGFEGTDAQTGPGASEPGWGSNDEAAAVAALAQKLARSAMEAMGSQELKSAQELDFQRLNAESKADVSEKLADAIERESGAHGNPPLPSLLDEVFRHDFIRQAEANRLEAASMDGEPNAEPATGSNEKIRQTEESSNVQYSAPAADAALSLTERAAASAAGVPAAIQPSAQAQFKSPAQVTAQVQAGLTLEGAVREMLRPLLVQWLNDNMPRILEKAIREEIASRGVFPKTE
jgi:cell pole-organizing protein PopZ